MGVNQCDLRCPLSTLRSVEYDLFSEGKTVARKLELGAFVGILGAKQMARSAFVCPQRNLGRGEWTASDHCSQATREVLDQTTLSPEDIAARIGAREFGILRPYLGPPPEGPPPGPAA